jgi:hypothetical protein
LGQLPFAFTESELQEIINCIQNITLPTWDQRPPINIGEPSHGKLKAHEYLSLFTCIFPLVISVAVACLAASQLTETVAFCQFWLVIAQELIKSGLARL